MTLRLFVLILVSVFLSAMAQVALKKGVGLAKSLDGNPEFIGFLLQPLVLTGLFLYGCGAILWLSVLSRADLSLAYPFVSLGFILTMAAGVLFLGESPSLTRIIGTMIIAFGCILVARS
ncbi:EamA family transporter [Methylobacterium oryzisoli]|uniref:EamA family transporter n=1 Tax=Methylobacterium oryzisoli TaxID=3385502 RepID=UPI0038925CD1